MRIQHVTLPMPEGAQEEGRAFYRDLLGMREKDTPRARAGAGLVWFEAGPGELEVHLAPDPDGIAPAARRHVCLEVEDVGALRARLTDAGLELEEAPAIPGRPRFYCRDPFGNLLELVTIERDYREAG